MPNIHKGITIFIMIALAITAFASISISAFWGFSQPLEAIIFVLTGIGFTVGMIGFPHVVLRSLFGIAAMLWSVPAWTLNYAYIAAHASHVIDVPPALSMFGASIPFFHLTALVYIQYALVRPFWRAQPQEQEEG